MTRWEYKTVRNFADLHDAGREGWELASSTEIWVGNRAYTTHYLKRPLAPVVAQDEQTGNFYETAPMRYRP